VAEVVSRFGEMIAELLDRHDLSFGQASIRTRGAMSPSYWSHLRNGRIPSREKISAIIEAFPDEDLTELWQAAGYAPPRPELLDELPPGAQWLTDEDTPMPLGPTVSAGSSKHPGDTPDTGEMVNLGQLLLSAGANYTVTAEGDCLYPVVKRGDLVVVRKAQRAADGQIVVARLRENLSRGELGGGYTLKVWHPNHDEAGYYALDGARVFHSTEARIVGVVERVITSPIVVELPHKTSLPGGPAAAT
jgi:SOS-response transcriptional repressor LexA